MARILSVVKPIGHLTLGNYLGAVRRWVDVDQHRNDALVCVGDLYALTTDHDPGRVRRLTRQAATLLLASGLDPDGCTMFVQSHVAEHTRLAYVMECVATDDELSRVLGHAQHSTRRRGVRLSSLTHPTLAAADVLAYRTDEVAVGDGGCEQVGLARDLAERFNQRYGHTFTVPRAVGGSGTRVLDLRDPRSTMGASHAVPAGVVYLLDEPDVIRRKIAGAVVEDHVAEDGSGIGHAPQERPGAANLLGVLAACTGDEPEKLAERYEKADTLRRDTTEAVVELLRPVQKRHAELCTDPDHVAGVLRAGAERARALARPTVDAAYAALGLIPAG